MWWFDHFRNPGESRGLSRLHPTGGSRLTKMTAMSAVISKTPAFAGVTTVFVVLLLSACGFHPMYGDHSDAATAANYSNIEIGNIPNRDGQYLRNQLIDRMYLDGRPADTVYALKIAPVKTITTNLGIRRDATATRAMVETDTTIQLVEKTSGKLLLQRDIRATGGYNLLDNQFATIVSRQSVDNHMLEEMAEDIVTELGLYFHRAGSNAAEMPVSIAKPTRSPSVPINSPAVPGGDPAPKSNIVPVIPNDPGKVAP
jgi:LPS-assembly lipoprotein